MAERRSFTPEFRADAIKRVEGGESVRAVSDDLQVHQTVLRRWLRSERDTLAEPRRTRRGGPTRKRSREPNTKVDIMLAAERLFGQEGLDGVSLRQITRESGQRNETALQYHFKTREGLLEALVNYRDMPLNRRRGALIDALLNSGRESLTSRELAEIMVKPMVEYIWEVSTRSYFGDLIQQLHANRRYAPLLSALRGGGVSRLAQLYWTMMVAKGIPAILAIERYDNSFLLYAQRIADIEHSRWDSSNPSTFAQTMWRTESLIEAILSLWDAPVPAKLDPASYGLDVSARVDRWKYLHGLTDDRST